MKTIKLTPEIEEFVDQQVKTGKYAANNLLEKILDKFEILATFPNMGKR